MFNGIIYNTGKLNYIKKNNLNLIIGIKPNLKFKNNEIGSSVSCNGVCLTLTKIKNKIIFFYISKETLNRSNLKFLINKHLLSIHHSL